MLAHTRRRTKPTAPITMKTAVRKERVVTWVQGRASMRHPAYSSNSPDQAEATRPAMPSSSVFTAWSGVPGVTRASTWNWRRLRGKRSGGTAMMVHRSVP